MGVFEIEGVARKRVECDIAVLEIDFRAESQKSGEASKKAMAECDRFLKEIGKAGLKVQNVRYKRDQVNVSSHQGTNVYVGVRTVIIRMPFEMKRINAVQAILHKGGFNYLITVTGDISYKQALKNELSRKALLNSKAEAEQLAEALGMQVKGVESIRKDRWGDEPIGFDGNSFGGDMFRDLFGNAENRESDNLAAAVTEEKVNLKVSWILE